MIPNIIVWLALVLLAIFFGWLVTRAWKARRWYIRWPGVILSGLLALVFVLISGIGAISLVNVYAPGGSPASQIQVSAGPEQIQRGEHIADVFCLGCHSPTGEKPMVGGVDIAVDIPFPVGTIISANLTPAGRIKNWTDGEIMRALREGVDPKGNKLMTMKNINARYLSDDDIHALIAYLRSMPAVESQIQDPPDQLNFLGVLMFGSGLVPELPPVTQAIVAPPKAASVEYGQYILSYQDCTACHGADLNGGDGSLGPAGPPLGVIKGWSAEQFISTLRTGINPAGHAMQPPMPWKTIAKMDDDELQALYLYIKSIK